MTKTNFFLGNGLGSGSCG